MIQTEKFIIDKVFDFEELSIFRCDVINVLRITLRIESSYCLLTGEWISKIWHVHKIDYFSALKRKEILQHGLAWINLEGVMLSEISQSHTQKDRYCMFPLI